MRKRILSYLKQIDNILNGADKSVDWAELLENHLRQIAFFQHERLIHLIVTVAFALIAFGGGITLCYSFSVYVALLVIALLCFLVPYVIHYCILEVGVQKMYTQYDRIYERVSGNN